MPAPQSSLATLRPDLAGTMEQFNLEADRQGFIGNRVLPFFDVPEQAGTWGKIPVAELLKNGETKRSNGDGYFRDDFEFDDDSYTCVENGAESPIDDRTARMYRHYFDVEQVAARRARDKVLRNREKRIAAAVFSTSEFGAATNETNEWDDHANATPVDGVLAAKLRVYDACGMWPNALVITRITFLHLRECAQIIDRLKYNGIVDVRSSKITAAQLAQVFDLEEVLVAGGTKNSATEGQTADFAEIWDKEYAFVGRLARTNDIEEPCVGRSFHWTEDGSMEDCTMETYRDETVRGDIVRARQDTHEKLIYAACGTLIGNVNTI